MGRFFASARCARALMSPHIIASWAVRGRSAPAHYCPEITAMITASVSSLISPRRPSNVMLNLDSSRAMLSFIATTEKFTDPRFHANIPDCAHMCRCGPSETGAQVSIRGKPEATIACYIMW